MWKLVSRAWNLPLLKLVWEWPPDPREPGQLSFEKIPWCGPEIGTLGTTRYFLPVKIVNRTCDIFLLLPAFLFFCCVCVADQNTRALLLHAYCYCLATRRLAVTHHPTYTQHEKREAKEKWQRRQTVENRTYGLEVYADWLSTDSDWWQKYSSWDFRKSQKSLAWGVRGLP